MAATISSRTPEGVPNHCPVCEGVICLDPSEPLGDAPCPMCGSLLWFIRTSHGMRLYPVDGDLAFREKLAKWAEAFVAIEAIDSLDVVELVMEIEGDFGVTIPDEEAENIKSTGDLLDYLVRLHLKGPPED
jgi:acyl carrier protein